MKNRIISTVLSALMLSSLLASSFAATSTTVDGSSDVPVTLQTEAPTFSVTVPTSLPLSMKADGSVVTATDCKITNSSSGPVKVTNVDISGTNGWSKLEYNTEFKNIQVDSTSFAMVMNEVESDIADTFSTINTNSDEAFTYAAKVAPQSTAISTDTTIATVVFTIGWDTVATQTEDTTNGQDKIENATQTSVKTGDIVSLDYNDTPTNFIVVQVGNPDSTIYDSSCDGVWLLSEDALESSVAWNTDLNNKYLTSDINTYLNSTVLNNFSSSVQSAIKEVKIPYNEIDISNKIQTGSNGLSTKIFLLSGTEVNYTHIYLITEGAVLDYFEDAINDTRVTMSSTDWWLRSPYSGHNFDSWCINNDGDMVNCYVRDKHGLRIAMILPLDYEFTIVNS